MPLHELSSEGSDYRCKSNLIQTLITILIRFTLHSAWFALIVVQKRIEQTAVIVLITARYANNLGIDRNQQVANSACATSAEHQDTQHPNALHAANAAARPTKAL